MQAAFGTKITFEKMKQAAGVLTTILERFYIYYCGMNFGEHFNNCCQAMLPYYGWIERTGHTGIHLILQVKECLYHNKLINYYVFFPKLQQHGLF